MEGARRRRLFHRTNPKSNKIVGTPKPTPIPIPIFAPDENPQPVPGGFADCRLVGAVASVVEIDPPSPVTVMVTVDSVMEDVDWIEEEEVGVSVSVLVVVAELVPDPLTVIKIWFVLVSGSPPPGPINRV